MIAHTLRFGAPVALAIATAGWLQLGILDVPLGYVKQLSAVYIDARVGYATTLWVSCTKGFIKIRKKSEIELLFT